MKKHAKMFKLMNECYNRIEESKEPGISVCAIAFQFYLYMEEVNINFHQFGKFNLLDEELPIVQGWINKLIGNRNIPKKIREKIAQESVDFASMVESVNNSHISTIDLKK